MAAFVGDFNMADKDIKDVLTLSLNDYNMKTGMAIESLKALQQDALESILVQDTVAMLPTGYGKSLIYELLPECCTRLERKPAFVLVVIPLNVIMQQQVDKLGRCATILNEDTIKALSSDDSPEKTKWHNGEYKFVFTHPEQIIGKKIVSDVLLHTYFQEEASNFIVIDEAHCVLEWGEDFRPLFNKLFTPRAILPNAKILALSATLSKLGQEQLVKKLGLRNPAYILAPPARDNISVVVCRRPSSSSRRAMEFVIEPLLVELIRNSQTFPLTIVYFSGNQDWVGLAYELAQRLLGKKVYTGVEDLQHARVVQFHSSMEKGSNQIKDIIIQNLSKDPQYSPLKLVLATVALGMGADLRYVRRVVNIGPPKRLEAYVQQMGRAGRTGEQSEAVLYYNNADIGRPEVSQTMKAFCKNRTDCRRQLINSGFGFAKETSVSAEMCCDICNPDLAVPHDHTSCQEINKTIQNALMEYVRADDSQYFRQKLSYSEILQISCAHEVFGTVDMLTTEFDLNLSVAQSICDLIKKVKGFYEDKQKFLLICLEVL